MRALEDTIVALGRPVFVRALGALSEPTAAIARWRHGAAVIDVAPSNTIRLAMSLVDRRNARNRGGGMLDDRVHDASVSIFSPTEGACVEVSGEADVVQLFLDKTYAEATLDAPFVCPPMFELRDDWMRTMIMRVLVGSARGGPDDALTVEEDLHALALRIERHATQWRDRNETPSALFRGGLAPAAFHRVEAMIEAAVDKASSPTLAEMADTVGLSVTYFVRAFRQHTGSTPHKYLVRRRMDHAVSLLRVAEIPIGDVTDKVGFSTPAHFVATFRAAMGVTPGAVRDALTG
jgi:AraC-like DNA-binding protein